MIVISPKYTHTPFLLPPTILMLCHCERERDDSKPNLFLFSNSTNKMGIARLQEREEDFELVQQLLVATAAVQDKQPLPEKRFSFKSDCDDDSEEKLVCVTSGVSFLGLAVVNRLLVRGYSVRIIVNNPGK